MGRVIDRRRVMGGKKLPYDAEIEFLQSSGTQYIDTGIKVTSNPKAVVELMLVGTQGSDYWGNTYPGAYANTDGMFSAYFFYGGISVWRYGNQRKEPGISFRVGLNVKFKLETGKKVILNDGEQEIEMSNDFVYSPAQKNIDIFRSRETIYSMWKLYTFKLYDAGELVRDYIPVRVGTTGYLYDKVSGELFGNQGTGDFILGPDLLGGVIVQY